MEERFIGRAKELIANAFAMDAHFDLALDLDDRREIGGTKVYSDRHDELIRAGGWNCIVSSLFIHSWQLPEMALRKALDQISALVSEESEQPDKIALCTTMKEVSAANAAGKLGIIVSFEGVDPLGSDMRLLQVFYRLGVRAVGLAWSRRNYAADGCSFSPQREGRKGGLTRFGVDVLEEAERLGMLVDISHLNDEGVDDVARFATRPFIASHSNCRALVPVMRNLTDDQIKLVADCGGVVGMNCASSFVSSDERDDIGILELSSHIDHIVSLVGDDFVGLGLDCCDRLADFHSAPSNINSYDSVKDHSRLPELASVLLEKGYKEESVAKIIGGNFRRVYEEVIG
ncbi:MAG: dipeptidase [Synergistaceae bacterium]|jgi:membrane dipeptidase|nr:dipeptidase [Synergistaceae bacterium]